uniref:UDP-glucuronosyltransferase n=1 Tax=Culicoides sonorensis TaxID=179676 RepID=A0A336KCF6_CULSO
MSHIFRLLLNLLIFGAVFDEIRCYNILGIFIHPGKSHFDMFHPLMRGLAERGHNVTVISHFPDKNPPVGYKDVVLDGLSDISLNNGVDLAWFRDQRPFSHYFEIFFLYDWGVSSCEKALNSTSLQKFIKTNKEKFDLIILEQFNTDCPAGIAYKFDAPFISLSSCAMMSWHYERFGMPIIPSHIPVIFSGHSENMNFLERLKNWFVIHSHNIIYRQMFHPKANELLSKYLGPGIPDVAELVKKTSIMMVNQHYSLSAAKPLPPAVIEVGGIHIAEQKPLDPELQNLLDTADNGVIFISWGSMVKADSMPEDRRDALLAALGQMKERVIWKWENTSLPNKPKNVYTRPWLPQRDILCHPKVRLFMSHGGLLGSSEAAYCGVPAVVTPMYGDQFMNAAAIVNRGMGVLLRFPEMTTENIVNALKKALEPEMAQNAKAVSYSYKHRLNSPLDTAIWWSEHVAATGGLSLIRSHAVDLPWYAYHLLDVWAFVLLLLTVTTFAWIWIIKRLCGNKKTKTGKGKKE